MKNTALVNIQGIPVTQQAKESVAIGLKQIMMEKKLQISYELEVINQLNIETFELTKEGRVKFSH